MGEVKNFRFKTTKGNVNIPVKDVIARERIGDLDELKTPHKDNLVNAINDLEGGSGGTTDYNNLDNKPSINGVTLVGNKTTEDLGIEGVTDYDELENKPTINGVEVEGNLSTEDLEIEYDDILNRPVESGDLDIDAVVDPLPTVVSKSNVVFDERGTEYEDGIYIKEIDGVAMYKPVWKKSMICSTASSITDLRDTIQSTTHNISNIETVIGCKIYCGEECIVWGDSTQYHLVATMDKTNFNVRCNRSALNNYDVYVFGYYTKTTDTWEEYEEDTQ